MRLSKERKMEKYTVNTDDNGYVLSIAHTSSDSIEIDISSIEADFLNAYKLVDGSLVLDESKKSEIAKAAKKAADGERVRVLKAYLEETDSIFIDMMEEIMASLSNPVTFISDMIKVFSKYNTNYASVLLERQNAKAEIEELGK